MQGFSALSSFVCSATGNDDSTRFYKAVRERFSALSSFVCSATIVECEPPDYVIIGFSALSSFVCSAT